MGKLVYIITYEFPSIAEENKCNGVIKKVLSQCKIFQKSFDTYLIGYVGNEIGLLHNGKITILSNPNLKIHRRFKLFAAAIKFAKENKAPYYYIRYAFSDRQFITMLRAIKNTGAKTIVEIPTFPYDRDMYQDRAIKQILMEPLDHHYRKQLYHYVDTIATFSNDKQIFHIPCINIANGICVDEVTVRKPVQHPDAIHLIGVASMRHFHGYDRVINGLNEYYQNGGTRKIIFHLVGEGLELPGYKKLTETYHLEDKVIFHGFQSGAELDNIFNLSDIAVISLGCHRINIFLLSSLKSREYAAKGLPMIASCKIDVFADNYPYLLNIPGDESPVNMDKVAKFYDTVYGEEKTEVIIKNIRAFAQEHCDMDIVMQPVIEAFLKKPEGEKVEC